MAQGDPTKRSLSVYNMSGFAAMQSHGMTNANLAARLARIESVTPYKLGGGMFAPTDFSPLDSSGTSDGKVNLGSTGSVQFVGSIVTAVVDGAFTVACPSDSSATIYYDGTNSSRVFIIRRADGTNTVIPPNNVTVTGLTAAATYTALAYWSPFNRCGLGWAPGLVGTPLIAFTSAATATQLKQGMAEQRLAGREEVGSIQWTQPTAGNTSPPAPPTDPPEPDPGTCVMIGTHIKALGNEPIDTQNYKWEDWVRIETEPGGCFTQGLNCTPNHPLYDSEAGKVRADFFIGKNRWIMTEQGEQKITNTTQFIRSCTKVEARMKRGHLFYANGFLSHNLKSFF